MGEPLKVGLIGSGFIARFHLQAFLGVRDALISGVFSPTPKNRESLAQQANGMGLGPCWAYGSVEALLRSGEVDAVWILGPNDTRVEHMREIHAAVEAGAPLRAVACEKPLGRNLHEAREMLRLAEAAGLNHGYLENQVFSTAVQRGKEIVWRRGVPAAGRPYLARASEEHSGPHAPWFWQGERQGGGVLLDMMCHSVEVSRYLLTEPGKVRESLKPISASATVANLKWTRPRYAGRLKDEMGVDYTTRPAEDFARGTLTLEDEGGEQLIIEATTSWSYVGPGLRIQLELLGPEYAMEYNTLNTGLKVFLSREVSESEAGAEDLVEKQNAEAGLMPVLEDEAAVYGYTLEDRHMVERFRRGEEPIETFRDGVAVVEMLMALYRSAQTGGTVYLPDAKLEDYVPPVARGAYRG